MNAPTLSVRNLEVSYGSSQALFKLSFCLNQGEVLAILGRNGAGKSTSMKAVAGVIPSTGGKVEFLGRNLHGLAPYRIARQGIGYVPEDRQIFLDLTVEDNLTIAAKSDRRGHRAWNLEGVYRMLPLLHPLRSRLGGQLSGGEQQMLAIGRALMGNPDALLLDEPSEGLAPIMVQKIGELIRELKRMGSTILLAEQNLHFCLALADRAVVIDKGVDVFTGTIRELNANAAVRQRYLSI